MHILRYIYSKKLQFGTDDQRQIYTLDSAGYTTQTETDVTNDGSIDKVSTYTLNEKGNILQKLDYNRSYDAQGVATDTLTQKEVYSVDKYGYTTSMARYFGTNDNPTVIEAYEVNALGQKDKTYFDSNADGIIDKSETYTRDANGNIIKTVTDVGNNNSIDAINTYTRDALGRTTVQLQDNNADSTVDNRYEYVLDNYGNRIQETLYSLDATTNELVKTWTREKEFNTLNQQEHQTQTNHLTGVIQKVDSVYNEQGLKTSDTFTNTPGSTYRWHYKYNDHGIVIERQDDSGANGSIETINKYIEFDEFNRTTLVEVYRNNVFQNSTIWEYAPSGHIIASYMKYSQTDPITDYKMGDRGANASISINEDMTTWTDERLGKFGESLENIYMTNNALSSLKIDAETVAKISDGGVTIYTGNDKNDSLQLEGFVKAETSTKEGFTQYTAEVDSELLNVFVSTDITTEILG